MASRISAIGIGPKNPDRPIPSVDMTCGVDLQLIRDNDVHIKAAMTTSNHKFKMFNIKTSTSPQHHPLSQSTPRLRSIGMWLLNKLRRSVNGSGTQSQPSQTKEAIPISVYTNVLTPNRIPDFFIPPKIMCCPPESHEALTPEHRHHASLPSSASDHVICSQSPRARGGRLPGSPQLLSRLAGDTRSLLKSANRHIIQIESADEPSAVGHLVAGTVVVNTNADPQSQTAMSLPYVPKAQTSYGFSTLVESPHTRRKESLFHSDPNSPLTSPNSQRRQGGSHLSPADPNPYRYFSGGDTSDTCSSAESSPFTSPLLTRSASLIRSLTQETKTKVGTHIVLLLSGFL